MLEAANLALFELEEETFILRGMKMRCGWRRGETPFDAEKEGPRGGRTGMEGYLVADGVKYYF